MQPTNVQAIESMDGAPEAIPVGFDHPVSGQKDGVFSQQSVWKVILHGIYQGSYNTERFNEFVRLRVLPICQPGTIIVLDNCDIHRSQKLKNLCVEAGVELAFLPPCSPDLNPIEQSFHALKEWIRRNRSLARDYDDNFEAFLQLEVESFMEGKDARGYYISSIGQSRSL